jgi:hypothetical protein
MATVDHPAGGFVQRCFDGFMLSAQIKKRYLHKDLSTETVLGPTHPMGGFVLPTAKNRLNLSCSHAKFNDIFRISSFGPINATSHGNAI